MIVDYKDRAAWLAGRVGRIGASEVAAILGLSPHSTPFDVWQRWHHPTGNKANAAMDDGTRWEDTAAQLASARWGSGFVYEPLRVAVHDQHPWLAATPDGWIGSGLWECKTARVSVVPVEVDGSGAVTRWQSADPDPGAWPLDDEHIYDYGDTVNGPVPVWYWVQVQIAMACSGADWTQLECWFPSGYAMPIQKRVFIHAEPDRVAPMIAAVEAWRARYLLANGADSDPPPALDPAERLAACRWRYPVRAERRKATADEVDLMAQVVEHREAKDTAEARMQSARVALVESMKGQGIWAAGFSASLSKNGVLTVKRGA